MINENTSYKLREIIMDTYPQLYWFKKKLEENKHGSINTTTIKETFGEECYDEEFWKEYNQNTAEKKNNPEETGSN